MQCGLQEIELKSSGGASYCQVLYILEVAGSNPLGSEIFSLSLCTHFLSRANAQKVLFGIFIRVL